MVDLWCGRPLDELSREELLKAVRMCRKRDERVREDRRKEVALWQSIADSWRDRYKRSLGRCELTLLLLLGLLTVPLLLVVLRW